MPLSDFVYLYRRAQPHVYLVGIVTKEGDLTAPSDAALGTAFAVSKHGHYLSAYHIVEPRLSELKKKDLRLGLKGINGYGPKDEPAFGVDVVEVFPKSDIVLLRGPRPSRPGWIPLASPLPLQGAWIGTIGYPLSEYREEKQKVYVGKRFVSAMISRAINEEGVRFVEIDKHLSHGHSGGPILTLAGVSIGVAVSYERAWTLVPEKYPVDEEIRKQKRLFRLPVQFARGSLIHNVASKLEKAGVPVIRRATSKPEPVEP